MKSILVLALVPLLASCVSMPKHKKLLSQSHDTGYQKANNECIILQYKIKSYIDNIQRDLDSKNERLRKFNQIDDDGSLRNPSNTVNDPAVK